MDGGRGAGVAMNITRSEAPEGPKGALVADCDLFSTTDGRVVDGDDPDANSLIARAGLPIPDAAIAQYGIKESGAAHERHEEHKEHEEKKQDEPKASKPPSPPHSGGSQRK